MGRYIHTWELEENMKCTKNVGFIRYFVVNIIVMERKLSETILTKFEKLASMRPYT